MQALLRQYLDVRIQEGHVDSTKPELHESLLHQAKLMEGQLWNHAVRAAELDGRPVTSGLFIQSLNELIDTSGTRNAALNRHVPEIVLFLMFATIVLTTATLGYASGIAGQSSERTVTLYCPIHSLQPQEGLMIQDSRSILRSPVWIPFFLLLSCVSALAQTTQEHVHQSAHMVMPFAIAQTVHIFKMTESGGVQQVLAKDPAAADQIALIRQHLHLEAENFQRGNYSDPAMLHGADMPGLKALQAGASQIKVSYAPLPAGAEITFVTTDLHLLTALHRWFGAQLSEHGADAKTE